MAAATVSSGTNEDGLKITLTADYAPTATTTKYFKIFLETKYGRITSPMITWASGSTVDVEFPLSAFSGDFYNSQTMLVAYWQYASGSATEPLSSGVLPFLPNTSGGDTTGMPIIVELVATHSTSSPYGISAVTGLIQKTGASAIR